MRVLVAVDGSEWSHAAVESIGARPWPAGSEMLVLCVVPKQSLMPIPPAPAMLGEMIPPRELEARLKDDARSLVDGARQQLALHGIAAGGQVRVGKIEHEIVAAAREWSADLVVVGSRGLTGIKRVLLGSVALYVAAHAPCSVEVVHLKAKAAA